MRAGLRIVVGAVVVLVFFTSLVHGLGIMAGPGTSDSFHSANDGLNEFKMKMAQIIGSANQREENGMNVKNQEANGFNANILGGSSSDVDQPADDLSARGTSTAISIPFGSSVPNTSVPSSSEFNSSNAGLSQPESMQNSSSVNQSLENGTSGVQPGENSTSKTGSGSGGSMLSQSSSISQPGIHSDNQASFNGDWFMQAGKQGFGNSGISDRMALSGDFNVHKSVSFKG